MVKELVFATNNAHKLEEINALLGDDFKVISLSDIGCKDDIPETGETFYENASQKSRYVSQKFKVDCFADDSGLEIDALNGEPGVHSAHYSGSRDAEENIKLVLKKLGKNTHRSARFKTVISLIMGNDEHFFEGSIEGEIIFAQEGLKGFGYDPIFVPKGYSKTFAEMDIAEKNRISHRAIATEKLVAFLATTKNIS